MKKSGAKNASRFSYRVNACAPREYHGSDSMLMVGIVTALQAGSIRSYADSGLTRRLPLRIVDSITRIKTYSDTFYALNKATGQEDMVVMWRTGSMYSSGHIRVYVQRAPTPHVLSISFDRLCDFLYDRSDYSSVQPFSYTKSWLWMRYSDVKPMLDTYLARHPGHKLAEGLNELKHH